MRQFKLAASLSTSLPGKACRAFARGVLTSNMTCETNQDDTIQTSPRAARTDLPYGPSRSCLARRFCCSNQPPMLHVAVPRRAAAPTAPTAPGAPAPSRQPCRRSTAHRAEQNRPSEEGMPCRHHCEHTTIVYKHWHPQHQLDLDPSPT